MNHAKITPRLKLGMYNVCLDWIDGRVCKKRFRSICAIKDVHEH